MPRFLPHSLKGLPVDPRIVEVSNRLLTKLEARPVLLNWASTHLPQTYKLIEKAVNLRLPRAEEVSASTAPTPAALDEAKATQALLKATLSQYVPHVSARVSTLGGQHRPSVMLTVSLDPKEKWTNRIMENSRYGQFSLNWPEKSIEYFSGSLVREGKPKFRKAKFKTPEDAVGRLVAYLSSLSPDLS